MPGSPAAQPGVQEDDCLRPSWDFLATRVRGAKSRRWAAEPWRCPLSGAAMGAPVLSLLRLPSPSCEHSPSYMEGLTCGMWGAPCPSPADHPAEGAVSPGRARRMEAQLLAPPSAIPGGAKAPQVHRLWRLLGPASGFVPAGPPGGALVARWYQGGLGGGQTCPPSPCCMRSVPHSRSGSRCHVQVSVLSGCSTLGHRSHPPGTQLR